MRTRIFLVVVLCLLGFFVVGNPAQEKSDEATIRASESKWADAYKQRQIGTLTSLLADDFIITVEDGTTYGKVGFVSYNMGPLRVDVAEMLDLKIRMHENVAVVTGGLPRKRRVQWKTVRL